MTTTTPFLDRMVLRLNALAQKKSVLWGLFILAILTRLIGAVKGGHRAEDDDHWHLQIAQNFLKGNGLRLDTAYGPTYSWIQPGFAVIHIAFMLLFTDFFFAERVFLLLFSSLTIIAFFYLCRHLFSPGVALFGALWLTLYPPQWFWMTRLNPHSFATNIFVIALLTLFMCWERSSWVLAFITGFLWGALTLMRPEYEMGILCLAFGSFLYFRGRIGQMAVPVLLLLGWTLFITPWAVRNYRITGTPVISTTHYGVNLWMVFNPDYHYNSDSSFSPPELEAALKAEPNEVKRARIWVAEAKKNMRADHKMVLERLTFNFLTYWRPWLSTKVTPWKENLIYIVSYVPLFLMFLWGLFKIPWRDPKWVVLITFLVYKVAAHVPFYMIVRFREATMPLLLLFALLPIQMIWDRRAPNERTTP